MTAQNQHHRDRLDELLAARAIEPLTPEETAELDALLTEFPDTDDGALDRAAASLMLGSTDPASLTPMPADVRARIDETVRRLAADGPEEACAPLTMPAPVRTETRPPSSQVWAWVAAAAAVLLAVTAWFPRGAAAPSAQELYAQLAASGSATTLSWNDAESAGVRGEIVWDQAAQRGVMRFTGLAANDPSSMQYQLWIFDAGRNTSVDNGAVYNAVDGGVFDVRAGGEVYIPVDAKLPVFDPSLFAVTTEPPGGVVKHVTRENFRIILTASAPAGA